MPGLLEWHLDAAATRLTDIGIAYDGPEPGGSSRILTLTDPDGNRVVLTGGDRIRPSFSCGSEEGTDDDGLTGHTALHPHRRRSG